MNSYTFTISGISMHFGHGMFHRKILKNKLTTIAHCSNSLVFIIRSFICISIEKIAREELHIFFLLATWTSIHSFIHSFSSILKYSSLNIMKWSMSEINKIFLCSVFFLIRVFNKSDYAKCLEKSLYAIIYFIGPVDARYPRTKPNRSTDERSQKRWNKKCSHIYAFFHFSVFIFSLSVGDYS